MTKRKISAAILSTILAGVMVGLVPTSTMAHPGSGIAVDSLGQVYFLDTGSGLWKIDTQGRVTRLSEMRFHWLALDENSVFVKGRLPSTAGSDWEILNVGANPAVLLSSDFPIAIGQDRNLYYPLRTANEIRIVRASPSGETSILTTLTGSNSAQPHIDGITAGPSGSFYYIENNTIRRITAQGRVGTVVTVPPRVGGPSIPGIDRHPYLRGLAVNQQGLIYVADNADARVLKITPGGKITTLLQTQSPWSPTAVALFGNDLYVLEYLHTARDVRTDWLPRIRKMTADGKSTIILTVDRMPGAR